MAKNDTPPEPKTVRWIERTLTDPQGADGVRHSIVRIVEGTNPPADAVITDTEAHDWKEDKE